MGKIRQYRLASQIIFFTAFMLTVLWLTRHPTGYLFPSQWFLRLNPLTALLTTVAARSVFLNLIAPALAAVIATLVFGRFFCGFVCPLGAVIDFSDRFVFRRKSSKGRNASIHLQKFKYVFLIAVVLLSFTGVLFSLLIDPISIVTRTAAVIVYPILAILRINIVSFSEPALNLMGAENLQFISFRMPLFYGSAGVLVLFVLILCGGFFDRRFWCQNICPSGALFGLLSRFPVFRRRVSNQGCNYCKGGNTCAKVCPTRAIPHSDVHKTSAAECIVCGLCTHFKSGCSAFGFGRVKYGELVRPDFGRRQVVGGAVCGVVLIPVYSGNALLRHDFNDKCIRPPGALPEKLFLARCLGCGNCVKACPTGSIQLSLFEDGFIRVYTPKIVPRIGGCEEKCHLCGYVCPTGAIRKLTWEEKQFVKIGTAVINKDKCLPWEQHKECLVCDEICPYNAITSKVLKTPYGAFKVPVVDEDLCLGCGMCEEKCPIFDRAAIEVWRFSENRKADGPYLSDGQKKDVLRKRKVSDSNLGKELESKTIPSGEFYFNNQQPVQGKKKALPTTGFDFGEENSEGESSDLPEGFTFD